MVVNFVKKSLNKLDQEKFAVAVVVLIALVIRFYYQRVFPFWLDETVPFMTGQTYSYSDLFWLRHWNVVHPQLFHMTIKWLSNFGTTPLWLRLPGIIFGSLSLIYLYRFVKLVTKSVLVGLVSILLAATSGFTIMLSIFSRPYGPQQFFVCAVIFYWWKGFSSAKNGGKIKVKDLIGLTIFSVLATFTDYSFLWILLVIGLFMAGDLVARFKYKLITKKNIKSVLFVAIPIYLPFIFWLPVFLSRLHRAFTLESYLYLQDGILANLSGLMNNLFSFIYSIGFNSIIFIGISIYFLAKSKIFLHAKEFKFNNQYLFWFLLVFIPPTTSLLVSKFISPVLVAKNLFVSIYPFLFFYSLVVQKLWRKDTMLGILLIIIAVSYQIANAHLVISSNIKTDHLESIRTIRAELVGTDLINMPILLGQEALFDDIFVFDYYFNFYDKPDSIRSFQKIPIFKSDNQTAINKSELVTLIIENDKSDLSRSLSKKKFKSCVKQPSSQTSLSVYLCKITPI